MVLIKSCFPSQIFQCPGLPGCGAIDSSAAWAWLWSIPHRLSILEGFTSSGLLNFLQMHSSTLSIVFALALSRPIFPKIWGVCCGYLIVTQVVLRMGKRRDLAYWNIPVPRALDEAVEKAVKIDLHISKSDLVRDAVRRLLKELGVAVQGEQ